LKKLASGRSGWVNTNVNLAAHVELDDTENRPHKRGPPQNWRQSSQQNGELGKTRESFRNHYSGDRWRLRLLMAGVVLLGILGYKIAADLRLAEC